MWLHQTEKKCFSICCTAQVLLANLKLKVQRYKYRRVSATDLSRLYGEGFRGVGNLKRGEDWESNVMLLFAAAFLSRAVRDWHISPSSDDCNKEMFPWCWREILSLCSHFWIALNLLNTSHVNSMSSLLFKTRQEQTDLCLCGGTVHLPQYYLCEQIDMM